MRTSSAALLATAARRPRPLLLALVLCACGGDGGDETDRTGAPGAAPLAVAAARDTTCPAPPAIDPALFTGSWAALVDSLTARGVRFPVIEGNHSVATLPLCDSCAKVTVALRADTTAYCTRREQLADGQTRAMGLMVLREPFAAQHGWNGLNTHDSIFMFASDTAGYATMVYRNGDDATTAPDSSWAFYHCADGHPGRRTRSHWRPRNPRPAPQPPDTTQNPETVLDFEDEGGSYGWMACASGCCQFYTPPPNPIVGDELPDRANQKAKDAVDKHRNAGQGGQPLPSHLVHRPPVAAPCNRPFSDAPHTSAAGRASTVTPCPPVSSVADDAGRRVFRHDVKLASKRCKCNVSLRRIGMRGPAGAPETPRGARRAAVRHRGSALAPCA